MKFIFMMFKNAWQIPMKHSYEEINEFSVALFPIVLVHAITDLRHCRIITDSG